MSLFDSIGISSQGLSVQRKRMELVAGNLANLSTTQTPEGGPYRRRQLVVEAIPKHSFNANFEQLMEGPDDDQIYGARATAVKLDPSPPILKFEPDHPHADADGYVAYPNVNPSVEMVDMVGISRSYEANLAAVRSAREMIGQAMDMLRQG
jgi:flagellar basal-body rod protein FlgC